jgi:hypothetical protein
LGEVDGYPGGPTEAVFTAIDPAILQIPTQDADSKIHRFCGDWSLQPAAGVREIYSYYPRADGEESDDGEEHAAGNFGQKASSIDINPRFLLVQTMRVPEY